MRQAMWFTKKQSTKMDKYEERKRIGGLLAERRHELGLTVRQLAERCGLNHPNIVCVENGKYSVGLDILYKIASAMGLELSFIKEGDCEN